MLAGSVQIRIVLVVLVAIAVYVGGSAFQPERAVAAPPCSSGVNPCNDPPVGTYGDDSCLGNEACIAATATVGTGSCVGVSACGGATGSIGNNSCIGDYACFNAQASIGDNSCQVASSCDGIGASGGSASIGDRSCNDTQACLGLGGFGGSGTVGDDSCNADYACQFFADAPDSGSIGDSSCNGEDACREAFSTVGSGSCNGEDACESFPAGAPGSIGNVSCNGPGACTEAYGDIADASCNGPDACDGGDTVDCEDNVEGAEPPGCNVEVTKTANPTSIPETGGTPVTYTVRIEFLEDEDLNSLEDDQFAGLSVATHCGLNGGSAPTLPGTFDSGDVIVCIYTYEPPPGEAGETHDNVVTINVGHPDCPVLGPSNVGPADHDCEIGPVAIFPGEVPGTNDVTAEASVLYYEVSEPTPEPTPRQRQERSVPNIGAGLSGLFNGMPTPLPTTPSAVVPAATTIRPPNTGDGGVKDGDSAVQTGLVIGAAAVLAFATASFCKARRST